MHQDLALALINEMLSDPTSPNNKILIKVCKQHATASMAENLLRCDGSMVA